MRAAGVEYLDLPWGECRCLDSYRSLLDQYVRLYKARDRDEFWKNYQK